MMIWIVISAMILSMVTVTMLIAHSLDRTNKKLDRKVEALEDCLAKLSEVVAERSEPELDPIEKKIQEAKWDVFNEWIDNIVNYDPRVQR